MEKLTELIERERPTKIILVGDVVSGNVVKHGISPQVFIVDNKVMRQPIAPISQTAERILYVKNPPGTLSNEAWSVLRDAIKEERQTKVVVDGEEDLLALVAVECAPESSFVVYGQPREGIVVVRVTKRKKTMVRRIVEAMERLSKA